MSPICRARASDAASFPRVSGDEPGEFGSIEGCKKVFPA